MFEVLVQNWTEAEDCLRFGPECIACECRTVEEAESLCRQLEGDGQIVARWRERS